MIFYPDDCVINARYWQMGQRCLEAVEQWSPTRQQLYKTLKQTELFINLATV